MKSKNKHFSPLYLLGLVALMLGGSYLRHSFNVPKLPLLTENELFALIQRGEVKKMVLNKSCNRLQVTLTSEALKSKKHLEKCVGKKCDMPHYVHPLIHLGLFDNHYQTFLVGLPREMHISYTMEGDFSILGALSSWSGTLLWLFIFFFLFGLGASGVNMQDGLFGFGKSKATFFSKKTKSGVTFEDVAGMEEAKEELKEVVDYLKYPKKYKKMGVKHPKGILLAGPPGTGKTLLAKAVAGEADVAFLYVSSSTFIEMFVGVGSSRIQDLFRQARKNAPCIIFFDEIDTIGRSRGDIRRGGSEESESTLNQLLTEMDGFSKSTNIVVIGATNRIEVLDSALLRPGRFDRKIQTLPPNLKERKELLLLCLKKIKHDAQILPDKLAAQTVGLTQAEIDNMVNEAGLIAVRKGKKIAEESDFQEAIDREIGGVKRKSTLLSPKEKRIVAIHETGHALTSWLLEYAHPLVKVTIVPRGGALGYAQYLPPERFLRGEKAINDELCVLLGGRMAEQLIFGEVTSGAQSDLEQATKIAYNKLQHYGMGKHTGYLAFPHTKGHYGFDKPYSEQTAEKIDQEARSLLEDSAHRAKKLLVEHKAALEKVAALLEAKETLYPAEIEAILGAKRKVSSQPEEGKPVQENSDE